MKLSGFIFRFKFWGGEPIDTSVYNSFMKQLLYISFELFVDLNGRTIILQLYVTNNISKINLT